MPRYYLTPASPRGDENAVDAVYRQLAAGWYSWGANTPHVHDLRPGDWICFYATPRIGVVAEAEVASVAEHSGLAGDAFPMRFRVQNASAIEPPIPIDVELRAQLDFFRERDASDRPLPLLVRVTRSVSEHDFRLLTGERPSQQSELASPAASAPEGLPQPVDVLVDGEEQERRLASTLTNDQRAAARDLLRDIGQRVEAIADGDEDLAFRLRRYVHARLQMQNRGTTQERQRRQRTLFERQAGKCLICEEPFHELTGTEIHRVTPGRYTDANTALVHRECHQEEHRRLGAAQERQ